MEQARADDPERSSAVALFDLWGKHLKLAEAYSVGEVIEIARAMKINSGGMNVGVREEDYAHPEFNSLLLERCSGRGGIDAKVLGKWLSKIKGQVHAGHRLEIARKSASHGNRWRLVRVGG
jgi:hypothetical protein